MSDYEDYGDYGDDAIEYDADNYGVEDDMNCDTEVNLEDNFIEAESSPNPIEAYKLIIELEQSNATTYKWSFKSYEKLCQIYIKNKNFLETQKCLNKLFDLYSKIEEVDKVDTIRNLTFVLTDTKDMNFEEQVFREMLMLLKDKEIERAYLDTGIQWAKILFKSNKYNELKVILPELLKYLNKLKVDDLLKKIKLEIVVMLIQVHKVNNQQKQIKSLYLEASKLMQDQIFEDNRLNAIINEEGGKIALRNMDYEQALQKFKMAFHNYKEAGDTGAPQVLKYAFLASLIVRNRSTLVSPEEATIYPKNEGLQTVVQLYNAYERMDMNLINKIWNEEIKPKEKDQFIIENLDEIFYNIKLNYLANKLRAYSVCKFDTLQKEIVIDKNTLIPMLLKIARGGFGMQLKLNFIDESVEINLISSQENLYGNLMVNFKTWLGLFK
jgi:hypothetical protein